MKRVKSILAFVLLLGAVAAVSDAAWADRGHHHRGARIGVFIGAPLVWPWYYTPPYHYYPYPAAVAVPASPPVYIERGNGAASSPQQSAYSYWYYCNNPDGYYPYVKECPAGWQKVVPQPPPDR